MKQGFQIDTTKQWTFLQVFQLALKLSCADLFSPVSTWLQSWLLSPCPDPVTFFPKLVSLRIQRDHWASMQENWVSPSTRGNTLKFWGNIIGLASGLNLSQMYTTHLVSADSIKHIGNKNSCILSKPWWSKGLGPIVVYLRHVWLLSSYQTYDECLILGTTPGPKKLKAASLKP